MSQKADPERYWQTPPIERSQMVLFQTTLDDRIPEDHPVRLLDEILNKLDWSDWEGKYERKNGQPPIHPSVLCKVLLFAMLRRIRSSRQIEYAIKHSIDFMWLVSGRTIDHTTISEFRRRNLEEIRKLHKRMLRYAMDLGLAKLSELCLDGTRIRANANRYKTWTVKRLEKLLADVQNQLDAALAEMETNDSVDDLLSNEHKADQLPPEIAELKVRLSRLQQIHQELKTVDERRKAEGIDPDENPAQLPKTDLDSRILPNKEGGYAPNYTPMCMNEMLGGFIVNASVEIGNVEHACLIATVDTVQKEYGITIDTLFGDCAYSTGENLAAMEARKINFLSPPAERVYENNPALRDDPSKPVPQEDISRLPINPSTKRFDRQAFVYDETNDVYYCPDGRKMTLRKRENRTRYGRTVQSKIYRTDSCAGCPLVAMCRRKDNGKGREVSHDEYHEVRRRHQEKMQRPESEEQYKRRQHFGETAFAVMKACFDMRRFLLRGIEGVRAEFQWACTAFNLKKLITHAAQVRAAGGQLAPTSVN